MSHGIRCLPVGKLPEIPRRPGRNLTRWCERATLLAVVLLAYSWLQGEIGEWQALLAIAGAPLTIVNTSLGGGFATRRAGDRARAAYPFHPAYAGGFTPASSVAATPGDFGRGPYHSGWDRRFDGVHSDTMPVPIPFPGPDLDAAFEIAIPTPSIGRSQHCVLFAVDIAQFTAVGRDDEIQLALREALYRLLIESFNASGIPWALCLHEDRGDGAIVVIPACMPTITVVDDLIEQIRVRLRRYNRLSSQVAQVRLRLAVHIGEVYRDRHGLSGKAVNHVFRMLDADELRRALQASESGVALIVSDYVYDSVIDGGPGGVNPAAYSEVIVEVKQTRARAWLLEVSGVA
jgi:hypothetical protein